MPVHIYVHLMGGTQVPGDAMAEKELINQIQTLNRDSAHAYESSSEKEAEKIDLYIVYT